MKERIGIQILSSYHLKWIAVITMVIDHIGATLFPYHMLFRLIGRISFPIFCFLIVEGFCHTSNTAKYMMRMGIFALVSEIPFDLAFSGHVLEAGAQNVFFTLFLGLLLLYVMEKASGWLERIICLILVMWVASFIRSDYSFKGILLIFWIYAFRHKYWAKLAGCAIWNFLWNPFIQGYGSLSVIPLACYNGQRGRKMKYFFYFFYPLHLLVLFMLKNILLMR